MDTILAVSQNNKVLIEMQEETHTKQLKTTILTILDDLILENSMRNRNSTNIIT